MAAETQEEAWRAQLERIGETAVRTDLALRNGVSVGIMGDAMQQFAFQWLRDKETERERRELAALSYVKWTFWAAVAAAVIGIAGVIIGIAGIMISFSGE
jgi:hypothetical protein